MVSAKNSLHYDGREALEDPGEPRAKPKRPEHPPREREIADPDPVISSAIGPRR